MKASCFFEFPGSLPFKEYFSKDAPVWEWVTCIKRALEGFDFGLCERRKDIPAGLVVGDDVYLDESVKLPAYGVIEGPAHIGVGTELRPGVYIRGNVIAGEGCMLGNSCEYKNCLLMDGVQTAHFNYVGDSILGTGAHLGAGVILANLRLDHEKVSVRTREGKVKTDLRKLGAIIGEYAEVGCNTVLQPGTLIGKKGLVGPVKAFGGYLEEGGKAF